MGIKKFKPTTPTRRWGSSHTFEEITTSKPERSLVVTKKRKGGRNCYGRITIKRRGGGHKQKIRIIDFKRDKYDMPAKVVSIEYDPNRSARIALLEYPDGERRYIIAPIGIGVNDEVLSSRQRIEIKAGNAMPLRDVPPGTPIYNIELMPGGGGKIARTAGGSAIIMAKEGVHAHVKLPSSEIRLIKLDCMATVGQVGNVEHNAISIGKAGRSRHMGKRPRVRGVAMNPHDHPMGGGEGKSSGGRHPCSPWGMIAKGLKTRKTKTSDRFILKRREKKVKTATA